MLIRPTILLSNKSSKNVLRQHLKTKQRTGMLQFKTPNCLNLKVEGEYTFIPLILWPSAYTRPDFALWREKYKESAVRNLIALLFYYKEISVSEISSFLDISDSRVRSLIKATKKRLFGSRYIPSKKLLDWHLKENLADSLLNTEVSVMRKKYRLETIDELQGNKREIQAVLYAIDRLMSDTKDLILFHHALDFAVQLGKPLDLACYEPAASEQPA